MATVFSPRIYAQVSLMETTGGEREALQLVLWETGGHVLQQTPKTPIGSAIGLKPLGPLPTSPSPGSLPGLTSGSHATLRTLPSPQPWITAVPQGVTFVSLTRELPHAAASRGKAQSSPRVTGPHAGTETKENTQPQDTLDDKKKELG